MLNCCRGNAVSHICAYAIPFVKKHPNGVLFVLSAGQFTVNAVASHRGV